MATSFQDVPGGAIIRIDAGDNGKLSGWVACRDVKHALTGANTALTNQAANATVFKDKAEAARFVVALRRSQKWANTIGEIQWPQGSKDNREPEAVG